MEMFLLYALEASGHVSLNLIYKKPEQSTANRIFPGYGPKSKYIF